jgi:hypothetical protein
METCKPKACEWYRDTGTTECLSEPETAEPLIPGVHDLGLDFDAGCGPMITVGAQCATYTEREGEMRCDTTCENIVRDHQPLCVTLVSFQWLIPSQ